MGIELGVVWVIHFMLDRVEQIQVIEFDGHGLDIRLKVVVRDPLEFGHEFGIESVWLLVSVDVCTHVVLGYHLVLEREYSCIPQNGDLCL